jgi:serine protease Do
MAGKMSLLRASLAPLAVVAMLVGATPAALAQGRPAPASFADLVEKLQPAVVNISTTQQVEIDRQVRMFPELPPGHPLEDLFRRFPNRGQGQQPDADGGADAQRRPITREARSLGSGFIIDPSGYVVTNNHVITGSDQATPVDSVTVTMSDGTEYAARIVGRDQPSDLALLKIEPKSALPFVRLGDSNRLRVGDWAVAIGNPFGLGGSVTAGIVSAMHRPVDGGAFDFFIQTDASINRGNSGGPLFNTDGEVIGINTAIYSPTGGNVGIGFSIPSSYAQRIIRQLQETGRVRRAWLGVNIQPVTQDIAQSLGLAANKGAIVASIQPNTPASRAGVRPGDVITAFDGKTIDKSTELPLIVSETPIGRTVDMNVLRGGKPTVLRVTVTERPGADQEAKAADNGPKPEAPSTAARQSLGITLTPLSDEVRKRLKLEKSDTGVVIASVNQASDAAAKGLRAGDIITEINSIAVTNPDQAARLVDEARKAGRATVLLRIRRGEDFFMVGVKMQPAR